MTPKLNKWSWLLVLIGCGRILASLMFWGRPFEVYFPMHLRLLAPYALLAIALVFTRTNRMARWTLSVVFAQVVVTVITCYEAPREFWQYLSLWINYIFIGQTAVAALFLFESLRQHRKERRSEIHRAAS